MSDELPPASGELGDLLGAAGATPEEIDQAACDGVLDLLAVEILLVPRRGRYTPRDVSTRTGVPLALLQRLWQALGFPRVDDDEPVLTDMDLAAVDSFQRLVSLGLTDADAAVELARVVGSSMARVAEAGLLRGAASLGAGDDSAQAAEVFARGAPDAAAAMSSLLDFAWRRHMQAVARRAGAMRTAAHDAAKPTAARHPVADTTAHPATALAVGFADMVGFTLLSQHLDDAELAAVVRRFEEISYDTVVGCRGRVVKTIGDEVMFVAGDPLDGARIGLRLADAYAADDLLGDVRVGVAWGPVLMRDGDYFGPTVNLAARVAGIAAPGTVLVADELHRLLAAHPGEFDDHPLRPRTLKDVGRVQLWVCRRASEPGRPPDGSERRRGWERVAAVLRDLDELRSLGERIVTAARHGPDSRPPHAGQAG